MPLVTFHGRAATNAWAVTWLTPNCAARPGGICALRQTLGRRRPMPVARRGLASCSRRLLLLARSARRQWQWTKAP